MKNKKIGAIIKNEVERSIKNKWFVILNLLLLVATVIGMNFNNFKLLLKNNNVDFSNNMQIYVEDENNIAFNSIVDAFKDNSEVVVEKKESIEEYENDDLNENIILLKIENSKTDYITASLITKETVI
jgi:hypothetical protein